MSAFRHTCVLCAALAAMALLRSQAIAADDGLRDVRAERYGVAVRVPQAWRLINWSENDQAFLLKLPQDPGSSVGYVSCDLSLAPDSLEEYQRRYETTDQREQLVEQPQRKLLENRIEPEPSANEPDANEPAVPRLVSLWEHAGERDRAWFEMRAHVITGDMLYTFTLATDEAHYEAYRLDFEDMLATSELTPPESGLQRMPAGYWMQRDFHFAMQLPEGWKPAFSLQDQVLFFATGATHEVFTDNLLVLASPPARQDLKELKERLPQDIVKLDPAAQVESKLVLQGAVEALESVIHTKRGPFEITILERRFGSATRNYEVRFTCETSTYEQQKDELHRALDSFIEVAAGEGQPEA